MLKKIKILFLVMGCCFFSSITYATVVTISPDQNPENNNYGMVGPFQITTAYSDVFGVIFGTKWTNYLTPNDAFAFELDFGGLEFRLAGTLAHSLTANQRVKLTAEHFAQQFSFEFLSGEKVQWAGENDIGGVYQYLFLNNSWLKNFSIGGYFTNAETETLNNNVSFFIPQHGHFLATQRFAGADNTVGFAGISIEPWPRARIEAAANYSDVNYDTDNQPAKDSSGPGGTLALEQVLTGHLKFDLIASHYAPYNQYQVGAAWLFNTRPGTRLELRALGSHLNGDILDSTDNRITFALAYSWDGDPCGPRASYLDDNPDDFITWTNKPAVYMPAVLVQKDERVVPFIF